MKEKFGPCMEKKCSWCCNPVKVKNPFGGRIPVNKNGEKIWKEREELLVPENNIEERLKTYNCLNFDENAGLCKDYENRPNICKQTNCIDENSKKDIDAQHRQATDSKFIRIPLKKKQ